MINLKTSSLFAIAVILLATSLQSPVFGEHSEASVFPDWVRQATSIWVNGQISDSEFLALIQNVLDKNILPDEAESQEILTNPARTEMKTARVIPPTCKKM